MKEPTSRKCRNRGLTPIRYRGQDQVHHGWIVERRTRGALTIHIVGEDRNRRLSADEARYVTEYDERK